MFNFKYSATWLETDSDNSTVQEKNADGTIDNQPDAIAAAEKVLTDVDRQSEGVVTQVQIAVSLE